MYQIFSSTTQHGRTLRTNNNNHIRKPSSDAYFLNYCLPLCEQDPGLYAHIEIIVICFIVHFFLVITRHHHWKASKISQKLQESSWILRYNVHGRKSSPPQIFG